MSIYGIDIGGTNIVIGTIVTERLIKGSVGCEILLNDCSHRKTPAVVSFKDQQRFIGEHASQQELTNFKNTVSYIKDLFGKKITDQDIQNSLKYHPTVSKGQNGEVSFQVSYMNKTQVFTTEQIYLTLLHRISQIINNDRSNKYDPITCTIAVPSYYTLNQRAILADLAKMTDYKCTAVIPECTATALAYGIMNLQRLNSEEKDTIVLFVDMGYISASASVVKYSKNSLTVLSNEFDSSLGGRLIDEIVSDFIAEAFVQKYHEDPRKNAKTLLKLRKAAEKCKLSLSPQGVSHAEVDVESLMNDIDFHTRMQLTDLESGIKAKHIPERLTAIIERALKSAGISDLSMINSTEITGGSIRIPLLKKTVAEFMHYDLTVINYGLSTTLNMDECIAIGCTYYNAIGNGKWKYEVNECQSIKIDPADLIGKGLTINQVNAFKKVEKDMQNQDEMLREKAEKCNKLESLIYSYRNKLDSIKDIPPPKKLAFQETLRATQDWLESYECESADAFTVDHKVSSLQNDFEALTQKNLTPKNERKEAYNQIEELVKEYTDIIQSFDSKYTSLTLETKDKVRGVCKEATDWLDAAQDRPIQPKPEEILQQKDEFEKRLKELVFPGSTSAGKKLTRRGSSVTDLPALASAATSGTSTAAAAAAPAVSPSATQPSHRRGSSVGVIPPTAPQAAQPPRPTQPLQQQQRQAAASNPFAQAQPAAQQQRPVAGTNNPFAQNFQQRQPATATTATPQAGYTPQQQQQYAAYQQQQAAAAAARGYPQQQQAYPQQQAGYPQQQAYTQQQYPQQAYPQQQQGYPQQQAYPQQAYPQQQQYTPQQLQQQQQYAAYQQQQAAAARGYPQQQQQQYPQQQAGYPQQQAYPQQGYGGYPQQQQYPQQGYTPQQQQAYNAQYAAYQQQQAAAAARGYPLQQQQQQYPRQGGW